MGAVESLIGYAFMAVVGWIFSKRGFQWSWFIPLNLFFMLLTLLLPGARIIDPDLSARDNNLYFAVSLFFAYPLPGFLAIQLDPKIPRSLPRGKRLVLRGFLYFVVYTLATLFAAFLLVVIRT